MVVKMYLVYQIGYFGGKFKAYIGKGPITGAFYGWDERHDAWPFDSLWEAICIGFKLGGFKFRIEKLHAGDYSVRARKK